MSDELRKALVTRGYELERRALSFATATPAVNMLLAELGSYARAAAEALSSPPSPDGGVWVPREPTEETLNSVARRCGIPRAAVRAAWGARLAAAPPAPSVIGDKK